jgi:enamine deaminase RidA (YjgF/YER057c/UK114 family)
MKGINMTNKQTFGTAHVPLSPAIRAGDFVFVSGQVPVDTDGAVVSGGIGPETDQVIANITKVLALADCTLSDIVKTTVCQVFSIVPPHPFNSGIAAYDRHRRRNRSRRV